jgi:hypothetical protein
MVNYIIEKGGSPDKERNDCTVRALAIATETSYAKAYMKLAAAGRRRNCGFHIDKILKTKSIHFNCSFKKLPFRKPITLQKFIQKYPEGIFYVQKYGHVFVIRDGAVLDTYRPSAYVRITKAWRVTKHLKTEINTLS